MPSFWFMNFLFDTEKDTHTAAVYRRAEHGARERTRTAFRHLVRQTERRFLARRG